MRCLTEDLLSDWNHKLESLLDEAAPLESYPKRQTHAPWLSKDVWEFMNFRDNLTKQLKIDNSAADISKKWPWNAHIDKNPEQVLWSNLNAEEGFTISPSEISYDDLPGSHQISSGIL
jgi:hypothetical protein